MIRVVKFGGSLLNLPDLRWRLLQWIELQSPAVNLMVVGGGGLVEAIRELDRIHSFDPVWIHWECIRLLQTTFRLMQRIVPELVPLETSTALTKFLSAGRVSDGQSVAGLVACEAFYSQAPQEAKTNEHLPESWATTTDALAAWLARHITASELVLLKSAAAPDPPGVSGYQAWADAGLVDTAFPSLARQLPHVRLIDFRDFHAN